MELASQYARALFDSKSKDLKNLRAVLMRRGHDKLLPRIYTEYQKLEIQKNRREAAQKVTPAQERTRILLDLYKKLTHNG